MERTDAPPVTGTPLTDATRHAFLAHFADAPAVEAALMLDEARALDPELADDMAAARWPHLTFGAAA